MGKSKKDLLELLDLLEKATDQQRDRENEGGPKPITYFGINWDWYKAAVKNYRAPNQNNNAAK